jgi:hypothetical protein
MKTHTLKAWLVGATLAVAAIPAAHADSATVPSLPTAGKYSLTPNIGTDFTVGGDFVKSGSQAVSNSSVFGAAVTGTTTFSVNSRKFSDVYDRPIQLGISGNYGLSNQDEVSAGLRYLHAQGKTFNALNVTSAGTINGVAFAGNAALQGDFGNYNEYGLDAGYRHFFEPVASGFHPYIGGILGLKHNNSVDIDLSYNSTTIANGIKFYESGWAWAAGLEAGFRYDIASSVALGLATGIRYEGNLRQDSTDINSASAGGLANVNNGGNRWDIPAVVGLTVKF